MIKIVNNCRYKYVMNIINKLLKNQYKYSYSLGNSNMNNVVIGFNEKNIIYEKKEDHYDKMLKNMIF